ncbi:MAG: reverse transcriptase family protein [Chloroflexota bacterium]
MWPQLKQLIKQLLGIPADSGHDRWVQPSDAARFAGKKGKRPLILDKAKLARHSLPPLTDNTDLARWLNISPGRLNWYIYRSKSDSVWHYFRFTIPKRSGGERVILAPKAQLKTIQRQILAGILERVPTHPQAHGFVNGRSIVTNATPHVGQPYVLNLDLKEFFPTITYARVRGLFSSLGYPKAVAGSLALLCTADDRRLENKPIDGKDATCYISQGMNTLIQGAPTSPAISNLIARRLDARLHGLARSKGFTYTRYADDLTFSGPSREQALRILDVAQRIIGDEGFVVNQEKTRLYPQSTRQIVTGIVVNDQVGTPRQLRRRIRAILHNARRTGIEAQNRGGHDDFMAHLVGLIAHVYNVNREQGQKLLEQAQRNN